MDGSLSELSQRPSSTGYPLTFTATFLDGRRYSPPSRCTASSEMPGVKGGSSRRPNQDAVYSGLGTRYYNQALHGAFRYSTIAAIMGHYRFQDYRARIRRIIEEFQDQSVLPKDTASPLAPAPKPLSPIARGLHRVLHHLSRLRVLEPTVHEMRGFRASSMRPSFSSTSRPLYSFSRFISARFYGYKHGGAGGAIKRKSTSVTNQ